MNTSLPSILTSDIADLKALLIHTGYVGVVIVLTILGYYILYILSYLRLKRIEAKLDLILLNKGD